MFNKKIFKKTGDIERRFRIIFQRRTRLAVTVLVNGEQKDINVSAVAINIITTQVIEAHIYLFIFYFLRNGNPYFRD